MSTTEAELYYDPYDFEIDTDPYPIWRRMREEAPLYWNEEHQFFALCRSESGPSDGAAALRTFSLHKIPAASDDAISRAAGTLSREVVLSWTGSDSALRWQRRWCRRRRSPTPSAQRTSCGAALAP